jgi:hypothetical protein
MKIRENSFKKIEKCLKKYDDNCLDEEYLIGLLNLQPTNKEIDDYLAITID